MWHAACHISCDHDSFTFPSSQSNCFHSFEFHLKPVQLRVFSHKTIFINKHNENNFILFSNIWRLRNLKMCCRTWNLLNDYFWSEISLQFQTLLADSVFKAFNRSEQSRPDLILWKVRKGSPSLTQGNATSDLNIKLLRYMRYVPKMIFPNNGRLVFNTNWNYYDFQWQVLDVFKFLGIQITSSWSSYPCSYCEFSLLWIKYNIQFFVLIE